jgi:hypothetical protein
VLVSRYVTATFFRAACVLFIKPLTGLGYLGQGFLARVEQPSVVRFQLPEEGRIQCGHLYPFLNGRPKEQRSVVHVNTGAMNSFHLVHTSGTQACVVHERVSLWPMRNYSKALVGSLRNGGK